MTLESPGHHWSITSPHTTNGSETNRRSTRPCRRRQCSPRADRAYDDRHASRTHTTHARTHARTHPRAIRASITHIRHRHSTSHSRTRPHSRHGARMSDDAAGSADGVRTMSITDMAEPNAVRVARVMARCVHSAQRRGECRPCAWARRRDV